MTQKKELIELFKSGDFTIAYHDNGHCCVYAGKWNYDDLPEKEEAEFDYSDAEGYCPTIVSLLTKALGGETQTI